MFPNPEVREVTINDYLKIIKKRLSIIVGCLIVIPLLGLINVLVTRPMYQAKVSIAIERSQMGATKFDSSYTPESDPNYLQTQYRILSSRELVEQVYKELNLGAEKDFKTIEDPVGKLAAGVKVELVKNSNIMLLTVEDFDSLRVAKIANTIAKDYIQLDIENRNRKIKEAGGWLEDQLVEIKNKIREAEERLNQYVQVNKIVADRGVELDAQTALRQLKNKYSALETNIAQAGQRYKAKHPKMIALNAEIKDTKEKIVQETINLLKLREKLVQYNILKAEVDSNQALYTNILTRSKSTGVSSKINPSNIRIIDSAKPPGAPFKPQKSKILFLSFILAIFCGGGISMFLEYLDATIRTAEDVTTYVNLPFLGYIPKCIDKDFSSEMEKYNLCILQSTSPMAESFRALRTSLLFSMPEDKPLKCILVTSSMPSEGKSFFAANLAGIFSQLNERIVIIDVDMRKPKLDKMLNLAQTPGLSTYLTGKATLDEILKPLPEKNNIFVITSGTIVPNPSELLHSGKVGTLMEELKLKFDRIVLDSPPVLVAPDALLLAKNVDGVVLLIKGASTRLEKILESIKKVREAKGKIIGAVINNIQLEKEDRYYYYHYNYQDKDKHK